MRYYRRARSCVVDSFEAMGAMYSPFGLIKGENPIDLALPVPELAEIRPLLSIEILVRLVLAHEEGIFSHGQRRAIDPLTLRSQLLLHLPRLVTAGYFPDARDLDREMLSVSDLVEETQRPYAQWLRQPGNPIALDDLEFIRLDDETAKIYHERFHYVGSYRPGSHFALRDRNSDRLVCIGSVARFDLGHVEEKIAPYVDPQSVFVFSRFFAFRWAPKNIFSYFHGRLRLQVKELGGQLMFSFINPNVGFDARSHKAAQWQDFAKEEGTNYMYLHGRYRTMRFFVENYGTSDPDQLAQMLGSSFAVSTLNLHPLRILAFPLVRRARKAIPLVPYLFQRPTI
jgi:hypothetical protein